MSGRISDEGLDALERDLRNTFVEVRSDSLLDVLMAELREHREKDAELHRLALAVEPKWEGKRQVLYHAILTKCGPT